LVAFALSEGTLSVHVGESRAIPQDRVKFPLEIKPHSPHRVETKQVEETALALLKGRKRSA
jgi:hypothetical protein